MSDNSLKVTDRRMFTSDGELREEFLHLKDVPADAGSGASTAGERAASEARPPGPARPESRAPEPPPAGPAPPSGGEGRRQDAPGRAAPGFLDLVGLLAEPAAHYMQEAHAAPPQEAAQSLALARLHIDLLAVLRDKTQGNLTPEEKAMLDDVVYQLRSGFVGLGG